MALVLASMAFYVKYTLQIPGGQTTFLLAAVLLLAIASVGVWAALIRRFSLMPVWRAAIGVLAASFVPLYLARSFAFAVAASAVVGLGFAGFMASMDLVGARIMDEDTARHGVRREGIIANALGFMNRLSGLFTSLAFYLIAVIFGFESGDNPGPRPEEAARFLLAVCPPVLMLVSLGFSFFVDFPRDEKAT